MAFRSQGTKRKRASFANTVPSSVTNLFTANGKNVTIAKYQARPWPALEIMSPALDKGYFSARYRVKKTVGFFDFEGYRSVANHPKTGSSEKEVKFNEWDIIHVGNNTGAELLTGSKANKITCSDIGTLPDAKYGIKDASADRSYPLTDNGFGHSCTESIEEPEEEKRKLFIKKRKSAEQDEGSILRVISRRREVRFAVKRSLFDQDEGEILRTAAKCRIAKREAEFAARQLPFDGHVGNVMHIAAQCLGPRREAALARNDEYQARQQEVDEVCGEGLDQMDLVGNVVAHEEDGVQFFGWDLAELLGNF